MSGAFEEMYEIGSKVVVSGKEAEVALLEDAMLVGIVNSCDSVVGR